MKYFHFVSDETNFTDRLECIRCNYTNPVTNARCKNRVCIGLELCWIHNRKKLHLKISKSNIDNAGLGLYAFDNSKAENEIIFRTGDKICNYTGERIDQTELIRRYGQNTAPYAIEITEGQIYCDSALHRGIGSLINYKLAKDSNCRLEKRRNNIVVVAIKNIRNGSELYATYGRSYQLHEPNVVYMTNNSRRAPERIMQL